MPGFTLGDRLGLPSLAPIIGETSVSVYLLDDQFASGTAPDGSIWTETDTGTVMSVDATNSRLLVSGGDGTNYDPAVWSVSSFSRAAVGALSALVRITGAGGNGPWVGMHPSSTAPTDPHTLGFGLSHVYPNLRGPNSTAILQDGKRMRSIDYAMVVVPRVGGGNWYFLSGGRFGTWPTATLVWADEASAPDPFYMGMSGKSGAWRVDHARVTPPYPRGMGRHLLPIRSPGRTARPAIPRSATSPGRATRGPHLRSRRTAC
jgi:hypothetical protein